MMDFQGLFSGFCRKSVFLVGDVMVDRFILGRVSRVSPEAPVPVVDVVSESDVLGGAANVVSILLMCGAKVFASGVVGDDDAGRVLREKLKKNKIDLNGIVVDGKRPTTLKTRIVAHNQQVVRVDREVKGEISGSDVEKIVKYFSSVAGRIDGVVVSDYCKGTVTGSLVERLVSVARKFKKPVVASTKGQNVLAFRGVDALLISLEEASAASGIRPINETSVRNMGNKILSVLDCGCVVITRGKQGFSVFTREGSVANVHAPDLGGSYDFRKTDDTAISFFALGLFSGLSFVDSAKLSCYAVEVLASKISGSKVTLEDIKECLSSNPVE